MINIDKSALIGKGHHRAVYTHPENTDLCIKVIIDGHYQAQQIEREKAYYRHLQKRDISWDMIPKYHGDIDTDMGVGSVFDLIADSDGSVSRTLDHYLDSDETTEAHYDHLLYAMQRLRDYLMQQRVITMTLADRNIACQQKQTGEFTLFVIDNIGNADYIPICSHVGFMARKKIHRRWHRFESKLLSTYKENQTLRRLLSNIHH